MLGGLHCGELVYKDVMSTVKMIFFSPEKLKVRKISSAWLLSLIYEGSDWTVGVMTMGVEIARNKFSLSKLFCMRNRTTRCLIWKIIG